MAGNKDQYSVDQALRAWAQTVRRSQWASSADIKASFASASIIGADRVVFNIKGNNYRLVAAVNYKAGLLFLKWFGTHAEYDYIDVKTVTFDD